MNSVSSKGVLKSMAPRMPTISTPRANTTHVGCARIRSENVIVVIYRHCAGLQVGSCSTPRNALLHVCSEKRRAEESPAVYCSRFPAYSPRAPGTSHHRLFFDL